MKTYGSPESIGATGPGEIAGRCGIPETAARAVRAAARLALENQGAARKKLNKATSASRSRRKKGSRSGKTAADIAAEDFAAETRPEYGGGEPPFENAGR